MSSNTIEESQDQLSLSLHPPIINMLKKEGPGEKVIFSDFAIKINRKDKDQKRIIMITDKGFYNIIPTSYKLKRRIDINKIVALSMSTSSDELVIHVAEEYDYRYKTPAKQLICNVLNKAYVELTNKPRLVVKMLDTPDLKSLALTKVMARLQSREDEMRRIQILVEDFEDSDKEDNEFVKNNGANDYDIDEFDESKDIINENSLSNSSNLKSKNISNNKSKVRIDDFELLKVLGRGSFGKVMQVRHKNTDKIYAMKILKKSSIIAKNQVEHTKAERKILQSLEHPFLMTLRYAFQSKDKLYFVLDYYPGGELFFHLKNVRRFPEEVAKIYIAEIALALGHLHSLGYIYRDLKPENILLDHDGHVCLTDFGLSTDIDENNKAHTFCGTPEYLAPEIVAGHGHDKAVDWWSLGILLYELTVGLPPFYDANPNDMYHKIQRGVLRFPPFLTEKCKSLIVALLNRTPEKRLGSMNDIEDIKNHPYYQDFNWEKLYNKEIQIPFKPRVNSEEDASNFDPTFTNEPVVDSVAQTSTLHQLTTEFAGFTFDDRSKDSKLK